MKDKYYGEENMRTKARPTTWEECGEIMDVNDLLCLARGRWSRSAIYGAIQQNLIPHRRAGMRILLSRDIVRRWLEGDGQVQ